jgi:hypothetical protein
MILHGQDAIQDLAAEKLTNACNAVANERNTVEERRFSAA